MQEVKATLENIDESIELFDVNEGSYLQDFKAVFTEDGMMSLHTAIAPLSSKEFATAIYSCSKYMFLIFKAEGNLCLVDTHPVGEISGGTGAGVIVIQNNFISFHFI